MLKLDTEAMRQQIMQEYLSHPNPNNDPGLAMEHRNAQLCADFIVAIFHEGSTLQTPTGVLLDFIAALAHSAISNIAANRIGDEVEMAIYLGEAIEGYARGEQIISVQTHEVPKKDVGDA